MSQAGHHSEHEGMPHAKQGGMQHGGMASYGKLAISLALSTVPQEPRQLQHDLVATTVKEFSQRTACSHCGTANRWSSARAARSR